MSTRKPAPPDPAGLPDLADVKGQEAAKRALEVAAAGNHSILLIGPRSGGKTLLGHCLPGLLPPPTEEEAVRIAEIYRRARLEPPPGRPFCTPHHSIRPSELMSRRRPGEVELAHAGILFLDDLPAFGRRSLRALRTALEATEGPGPSRTTSPASRCLLVAAMRSCPCGHRNDWRRECSCPPWKLARYLAAVEELVLDLFHVRAQVPCVTLGELRSRFTEPTRRVAERVREARERQLRREGQETWNAHLPQGALPKLCALDKSAQQLLDLSFDRLGLTVRTVGTILRVTRTIADLAGSEVIRAPHLAEAVQYRSLLTRLDQQNEQTQ